VSFPITDGFAELLDFIRGGARENIEVLAPKLPKDLTEGRSRLRILKPAPTDQVLHEGTTARWKQRQISRPETPSHIERWIRRGKNGLTHKNFISDQPK
jgi:hypothetical protein